MSEKLQNNEKCITNFTGQTAGDWEIVNDGVMGGCSESNFQINDRDNAIFKGSISQENNGGFASVRHREPLNFEAFSQLHLRLYADGQRYCFRLRTADENGDIHRFSYDYRFNTKPNSWLDMYLPLPDFLPFFRGRQLNNVPPLDRSSIRQYGFLISDKQEGPFKIEIAGIWGVV